MPWPKRPLGGEPPATHQRSLSDLLAKGPFGPVSPCRSTPQAPGAQHPSPWHGGSILATEQVQIKSTTCQIRLNGYTGSSCSATLPISGFFQTLVTWPPFPLSGCCRANLFTKQPCPIGTSRGTLAPIFIFWPVLLFRPFLLLDRQSQQSFSKMML